MGKDADQMSHDPRQIAFLFDLDGVIIDSERSYSRFWQGIDKLYPTGIPSFDRVIKGTTLTDILERYFPDPEVRKDVERKCWELESIIRYGYEEGAKELLVKLKELGIPTVMVTSSDRVKMDHLWLQLPDLKDLFSAVIDGDMVTKSKPDPEGYLKAASMVNASPSKCVVFEDSLTGVKAGKAAGAYVIGMTATLGKEKISPYADRTLDSLTELDLNKLIGLLEQR